MRCVQVEHKRLGKAGVFMKKALPIGYDNFKRIISDELFYVDKTMIIKELIDKKGQVNLFTRPRRFGKTLILSMLRTFFEKEIDVKGNVKDNSSFFDGMKIMQAGEKYVSKLGQYPVISLSLKSGKQPKFEMAYASIVDEISKEFKRHAYILKSDKIFESEKVQFQRIVDKNATDIEYAKALEFLSACLTKAHGKNTIILIDEYDVPLENAHFAGFYDEMIGFIRSLFESALKTNDNLEFAVVTGCLRISKESIFTGLNNLEIISILSNEYAEYFGFTQAEVEDMLSYYEMTHKLEEAKDWYNGYIFGNTQVYNPWSMINYVKALCSDSKAFPKSYWSNTSSNSIVRELIEAADENTKREIEGLIAGGTIEKPVHEEITYADIYTTKDNLWNFLFFTGYLKAVDKRFEVDTIYLTMKIPNVEIRYIYRHTIREWFSQRITQTDFTELYKGILEGRCEDIEQFISRQLATSISYHDALENFYHGYLLGILSSLEGYAIESNREHGDGRPDLVLSPHDPKKSVIIIEVKRAEKYSEMEKKCEEALQQIEEKNYAAEYFDEGYKGVVKYGFCFCKKSCMVKGVI